jgi:hypothetical protein
MQFNISKTFGDNKLMTATILLNPETLTYRKVFDSVGRQHFKECYELNNSAAFAFPSF